MTKLSEYARPTKPVGYICRNRNTQGLFPKVGTEALPAGSEIVAVIIGGKVTVTDPMLDSGTEIADLVEAVNSAIEMGSSSFSAEQFTRQVDTFTNVAWNALDDQQRAYNADRIRTRVTALLDGEHNVDVAWYRNALQIADQYDTTPGHHRMMARAALLARFPDRG